MMFVFSDKHNLNGIDAVMEILVFSSEHAKQNFEKEFATRKMNSTNNHVATHGIGVVYILRGVMAGGLWVPIIRCGFSGEFIWEGPRIYKSSDTALMRALNQLREVIWDEVCDVISLSMPEALAEALMPVRDQQLNVPKALGAISDQLLNERVIVGVPHTDKV